MGLRTNLISWWDLEESTASSSWVDAVTANGNDLDNNSSGSGVTSATGKQGQCASFNDANSEVLDIANGDQTNLAITGNVAISLSMWFQISSTFSTSETRVLTARVAAGTGRGYKMFIYETGGNHSFRWAIRNDSDAKLFFDYTLSGLLTNNQWYHLVVTKAVGTAQTMYLDGVAVGSQSNSATNTIGGATAVFEMGNNGSDYWDGLMESVGVWDKVLTADEVSALYNGGDGINYADTDPVDVSNSNLLTKSLVAHYELEEATATTTWTDSHSTNDLTNNSTGSGVTSVTGKQGQAGDLTRSSAEYLSIADNVALSITGDISFAMWVKPDANPSGGNVYGFVGKGDASSGSSVPYSFRYYDNGGTPTWSFYARDSGGTGRTDTYAHTISTSVISHVACVVSPSGNTIKFYYNGAEIYSGSASGTWTGDDDANATAIGRGAAGSGRYWDGLLDEVGIYSKALTLTEIEQLYASGSGLPYAEAAAGPATFKTFNTIAAASTKTIDTIAIASIKTINTAT